MLSITLVIQIDVVALTVVKYNSVSINSPSTSSFSPTIIGFQAHSRNTVIL
jgi:hypothetical protein